MTQLEAASEPRPARGAQVFYDGHCALCRKSVAMLKRLDWLKTLTYVDVRVEGQEAVQNLPVANGRLLEEMHVLTPNRQIHHGFAAFRWMAWRLPLLWFLAPILFVPGVPTLGQRLYLWVARNRFRLVPCHGGVCTIQKKQAEK